MTRYEFYKTEKPKKENFYSYNWVGKKARRTIVGLALGIMLGKGGLITRDLFIKPEKTKFNLENMAETPAVNEPENSVDLFIKEIFKEKRDYTFSEHKDVQEYREKEEVNELNNLEIIVSDVNEPSEPEKIYSNPKYDKDDNFALDSEDMTIARVFYGEWRSELNNPDVLYGFERILKNRAKKWNINLKHVALRWNWKKTKDKNGKNKKIKVWNFSCFSPNDVNYKKIKNPVENDEDDRTQGTWKKCYELSKRILNKDSSPQNEIQKKLETSTNYWIDSVPAPIWAYIGNDKEKGLREPLAIIPVLNRKYNARFYCFEYP